MSQSELFRAVARATGETVGRVRRMGFGLMTIIAPPPPKQPDPRSHSQMPDGDHAGDREFPAPLPAA